MTAREERAAAGAAARTQGQPGLRLSPERVRAQEFSRGSLGRRGYNEDEVRQFLGRVAEDITASDAEKTSMRSEIERLRNRYRDQGREPAAESASTGPPVEAVNLLSAAQQQADACVAQAQEYSRQVTSQARQQAEAILHEAQSEAESAAEAASRDYRADSGEQHSADLEQMERRIVWIQTFCQAVQTQIQTASDAFSQEIGRLGELSQDSLERTRTEDPPG